MTNTLAATLFFAAMSASVLAAEEVVATLEIGGEALQLSPSDFIEASPTYSNDYQPGIQFELTPELDAKILKLTKEKIGETLSFWVCGDALVEGVTIEEPLSGRGNLAVEGVGTAVFYASRLKGENSCD